MSVERRIRGGRVRYLVRWREAGVSRARTFDRKEDAESFERQQRRLSQLGAHVPAEPSRDTLVEWLRIWWRRNAHRWAASTRYQRGRVMDRWIVPFIGGVPLRDLGTARVRDWQGDLLERGCPASQANSALKILSAALGSAVEDGSLPANPCARVRKVPEVTHRPRALTPHEVERIRAQMPTLRDVALVGLLAYAGLRPEEALALRWGDVGRVLVIDRAFTYGEEKGTKSAQRRAVDVVAPLARDLDLLRPKVVDPKALVVPADGGGHLSLHSWRRGVWRPAGERAGVRAAPYDGRHTYASLLLHEGRSLLEVAVALGHSSVAMIDQRYGHVYRDARLAPATGMVDAIEAVRAELVAAGVYPRCTESPVRVLRARPQASKKRSLAGDS